MARTFRLAVAQSTVAEDPGDVEGLRAGGAEIRDVMRQGHAAGARMVQFPEARWSTPTST